MNWLERYIPSIGRANGPDKSSIPEGLWISCKNCQSQSYKPELEKNLMVCSKCAYHMRLSARKRLEITLDKKPEWREFGQEIKTVDVLKFKDTVKYKERLSSAQSNTSETEALLTVTGEIGGMPVVVAAFEFAFLGGSMGMAVGEKYVMAVEKAVEKGLPFISFATSGGARMQESMFSLLQMARTSAALEKFKQKKNPYISVLLDPVYGGVTASLAMLGDVNIAEPDALIGFTGPRVIEQTVRVKLPETFQRSEFLLKHGAIDMIVSRYDMRDKLISLLKKFRGA